MHTLKNIDQLPCEVRKLFLPFLEKFVALVSKDLSSLFIFGSATGSNYIAGHSDVNSVAVVQSITPALLCHILDLMKTVRSKRIKAPLVLTNEHIRSSLDVFPIEFLEMKDQYVTVYGYDCLKDMTIDDRHARLFCEQQIKGRLIHIRQEYVHSRGHRGNIELLMKESLNTLFPVFRTLLRMRQVPLVQDKCQILEKIKDLFHIDVDAMLLIWKDKKNDRRISGKDVHDVFGQYIIELENLANVVDQL